MARLLDPGEVFWDVGANVGYFSLVAAAAVGETGEVAGLRARGRVPGTPDGKRLAQSL